MSALIRSRSRIVDTISRRCNRRFSSSGVGTEPPTPPRMKYLKWGSWVAGGTSCMIGLGYFIYAGAAYHIDWIEEKVESLNALSHYNAKENASTSEKFQGLLYSSKMTVMAKVAKAYLDFRKLYDVNVIVLPDDHPLKEHALTLVLDLNETLVFSGWTGGNKGWVTVKRPGVDSFLEELSKSYEIVVFSDQLRMYVDAVVEKLDPHHFVKYKLARFDMKFSKGKRYKDFNRLHRDPAGIIYVTAYAMDRTNVHPQNTLQIQPWKGIPGDTALLGLVPFLKDVAKAEPTDVRVMLASYREGSYREGDRRSSDGVRWFRWFRWW